MLKDKKEGQLWVEPFVGGCNIIDKVQGNRLGCDVNPYLIELFKGIQNGFIPPDIISEKQYHQALLTRSLDPLTGFIGFGCSYSGKWFGGYARGNNSSGSPRNYCLESKKNILKQKEGLKGVDLRHQSYAELCLKDPSLIYCDPPYRGTTKYKSEIDHQDFYTWCSERVRDGHTVYVSEFNIPDPRFVCV